MLSRPVQICFNPFYKSRLRYIEWITIFCPNDPFKNNAVIAKKKLKMASFIFNSSLMKLPRDWFIKSRQQFLSYLNETVLKLPTHALVILTKFSKNWVKILVFFFNIRDFFSVVYFFWIRLYLPEFITTEIIDT